MIDPNEWPQALWLVRHGESAGNLARDAAHASGRERIELATRDVDVPLSDRGVEQAQALGAWFAHQPKTEAPQCILASPYRRAVDTAQIVRRHIAQSEETPAVIVDERLREKEFGILDRLTRQGIEKFYPDQAEIRRALGKFYHRPPGGESWCDVILRLRSALNTLSLHYSGRRVLIVGHQVVVLCFRYLLEKLSEADILRIDSQGDVANCSITHYALGGAPPQLRLVKYNWTVPLEADGAPVTAAPDVNEGTR
ncbi:MAG: histidine phosphatase family protein [Pseudomonadota bacterium]|nr:histidine phosphatase family protein [Pseudomonadota bacterium]